MPPSYEAGIVPRPENARAEWEAAALEKSRKPTGETSSIHIEEETVAPMVLEVGRADETELCILGRAIVVPGTLNVVDDRDVEGEVQCFDRV